MISNVTKGPGEPAREVTWEGSCFAGHMTQIEAWPLEHGGLGPSSSLSLYLSHSLDLKKLAWSGEALVMKAVMVIKSKESLGILF